MSRRALVEARHGEPQWPPSRGGRHGAACIRIYRPTAIGPLACPLSRWRRAHAFPGVQDQDGRVRVPGDDRDRFAARRLERSAADWRAGARWAEQWFETTAHLKPKTRVEYASNLRNHVLPFFGDKPVGAIDSLGVRQFVSALRADGLEHGTVKKAKAVLSMVLGAAAEAGAIKANPCANIRIGRAARREMVFLTADEVEALATAIVEPYGTLVRFAAYTGLRAGEIAALRVGRLDMLRRRVEVAESLSIVPGQGLVFGPTKNYQRRTVPVPAFLADELAEYLASCGSPGRDSLVFTSQQGAPLRQHHFYWRYFKPAVQRAGLGGAAAVPRSPAHGGRAAHRRGRAPAHDHAPARSLFDPDHAGYVRAPVPRARGRRDPAARRGRSRGPGASRELIRCVTWVSRRARPQ